MRTLTATELTTAKAQLEIIQAIQREIEIRRAYSETPEFQVELTQPQQIAHLTITTGIMTALCDEVDRLAESVGVDFNDSEDTLADVIDILDGNRRQHRNGSWNG